MPDLEDEVEGLVQAVLGGNDILEVEREGHVEDDVEEEHEAAVGHRELVHGADGSRKGRPTSAHAYQRSNKSQPFYSQGSILPSFNIRLGPICKDLVSLSPDSYKLRLPMEWKVDHFFDNKRRDS